MRYAASERLEIIRLVEHFHLRAKRTLDHLGVARRTFYRCYDRCREGGPEALQDRPSAPSRVWNRIPAEIHAGQCCNSAKDCAVQTVLHARISSGSSGFFHELAYVD